MHFALTVQDYMVSCIFLFRLHCFVFFLWLSVTMLFKTPSHQLKTAGKQLSKVVNGYEKDL